jgi:hypothetical protein
VTEQVPSEDRLRDEALAKIAKSGRCYTNEARAMAAEIIKRRAAEVAPAMVYNFGNILGGKP